MGKRKKEEDPQRIYKKLKKWEKKMKQMLPGIASDSSENDVELSKENRPLTKDLDTVAVGTVPLPGTTETTAKTSEETDESLQFVHQPIDDETLKILGEDLTVDQPKELRLHPSLVAKWNSWLMDGLKKEDKTSLLVKYPRAGECNLEGPKLNPEIASSVNETMVKRDKHFMYSQNVIGSAMAALGAGITALLNDSKEPVDKHQLLEYFWESGKLLSAAHHQEKIARKAFIVPGFDKKVQTILNEAKADSWLFGVDLADRIKSAKTIEKVGSELKPQSSVFKPRQPSNQVNWKGPSAKNQGASQVGRHYSNNNNSYSKYQGKTSYNKSQSQRGKPSQSYQRTQNSAQTPAKSQQKGG